MIARSALPWITGSAVLLCALFIRSVFSLSWPINHDCAMYLASGQLLLQGKLPYIDFIDLNPPLIFYLNALPAYLSQSTGIDPSVVFGFSVWIICLIAWLLAFLILRATNDANQRFAGPLLFGFAAFNMLVGEWGEFGQRQHLFAVVLFPFFILRWLRADGRSTSALISIATGILFGVGLALVPQYALIPMAIELFFLIKKKQLSTLLAPEVISVFMMAVLYGISFCFLPDFVRSAFLHRWLPLIASGYGAYNSDWQPFVIFPFLIGCFPLWLVGAQLTRRHRCELTVPMHLWCLSAYIAALVQLKGWYNHYLPLLAGVCLLVAIEIEMAVKEKTELVKLSLVSLVLFLCSAPSIAFRETEHYFHDDLAAIKRETKPGDNVIVLSTAVPDIYPTLLLANCKNGSRFLFLFPFEMLDWMKKAAHSPQERTKLEGMETECFENLRQDLATSQPKLILVPSGKSETDTTRYFSQKGLLGDIKKRYDQIGEFEGRRTHFTIFRRKTN